VRYAFQIVSRFIVPSFARSSGGVSVRLAVFARNSQLTLRVLHVKGIAKMAFPLCSGGGV